MLGRRLAAGLDQLPGLAVPPETRGGECSYWFLLLQVEPDALRISRDELVAALRAEGVDCAGAYLPSPVPGYDVFRNHDFFAGRWPLREAGLTDMDYSRVMFPQAERMLSRGITLTLHEAMNVDYIDGVIAAFGKLLTHYAS
jgi:dTDP-4-amino-4,6-dideoxygalactose transaminase